MLGDIRYAWRRLKHSPGFARTVVVMLAPGVGALRVSLMRFVVADTGLLAGVMAGAATGGPARRPATVESSRTLRME